MLEEGTNDNGAEEAVTMMALASPRGSLDAGRFARYWKDIHGPLASRLAAWRATCSGTSTRP